LYETILCAPELRQVQVDNKTLMVHRCEKWVKLSGMDLLPGDVLSIGRSAGQSGEESFISDDMLLQVGSEVTSKEILIG
jgi:cation-transporting ATPase 13A1